MKPIGSLLIAVVSIFILITTVKPVYSQEASTVRVTRVDGTVTRNNAPLKEGDIIQRDDRIITGEKSATVLTWSNGSILELYPQTSILLNGVIYDGERKLEKSLITLEKGRIFAKAQVPEHIFTQFDTRVENLSIMSQGAEFALKFDHIQKGITVWSLIGKVLISMDRHSVILDDGQEVSLSLSGAPEPPVKMSEKTKEALMKVSRRLGGSLLFEEETVSTGGPLKVKVGGVRNRRGDAPYTVKFKAIISGGSGKTRSVEWTFGDGESAEGKEITHKFTIPGVYGITVRVEDENGDKATGQISISVEEECGC